MKKKHVTAFVLLLCLLTGCSKSGITGMETSSTDRHITDPVRSPAGSPTTQTMEETEMINMRTAETKEAPAVYMTTDISPEGLKKVYDALGRNLTGNVAVKLSTGEAITFRQN